MIARVLVANRGEIAVRVIRACHGLGIEADRRAQRARCPLDGGGARRRCCRARQDRRPPTPTSTSIGSSAPRRESGCDAVHPGYGFLAERADFAARGRRRIVDVDRAVGRRHRADGRQAGSTAGRHRSRRATGPRSDVRRRRARRVRQFGDELGWPLAVKAVHGGGGRGMRVVAGPDEADRSAGRGATRGAVVVRAARAVRRAVPRPSAPRRGATRRRPPRWARRRRRPRLLDPTPLPEADRGGARPAPSRRRPRRARRGSGPRRPSGRLHQRRNDRVPRRRATSSTSSR